MVVCVVYAYNLTITISPVRISSAQLTRGQEELKVELSLLIITSQCSTNPSFSLLQRSKVLPRGYTNMGALWAKYFIFFGPLTWHLTREFHPQHSVPWFWDGGSGCSGIGGVHPSESPHWETWVHFMGKSPFPHHPLIFHFALISSLCWIFPITLVTYVQVDEYFHSCFFAHGPRTLPLG